MGLAVALFSVSCGDGAATADTDPQSAQNSEETMDDTMIADSVGGMGVDATVDGNSEKQTGDSGEQREGTGGGELNGDGVQADLDAVNGSGEGDPMNQESGSNEEEDPSNGETTQMPDEDTMDVSDVPPAEQGESDSSDGPCPLTAPEVGTACENLVSYCAYGDSPFVECREVFSCNFTNNQWQVTRAPNTSRCQNTPQESCPETVPEGSCEPTWAQCAYPDAACTCVGEQTQSCGGDGCYELDPPIPQQWSCREGTEECPLSPPNAGAPCDADTPPCVYGEDCTGIFVRCVDGYVQWVENLCA